jgi:hypothetical protein
MKQINSATKPQSHKDAQSEEIQCVKLSEPLSLRGFVAKKYLSTYYCFISFLVPLAE